MPPADLAARRPGWTRDPRWKLENQYTTIAAAGCPEPFAAVGGLIAQEKGLGPLEGIRRCLTPRSACISTLGAVGEAVRLREADGDWGDAWDVAAVGPFLLSGESMRRAERSYIKHRKAAGLGPKVGAN